MADISAAPSTGFAPPLASVHTTSLPALLQRLGIALAVTTYQAGKLILVRADDGKANTHCRTFQQPMEWPFAAGGWPSRIEKKQPTATSSVRNFTR